MDGVGYSLGVQRDENALQNYPHLSQTLPNAILVLKILSRSKPKNFVSIRFGAARESSLKRFQQSEIDASALKMKSANASAYYPSVICRTRTPGISSQ
jgi:hypothetical protein